MCHFFPEFYSLSVIVAEQLVLLYDLGAEVENKNFSFKKNVFKCSDAYSWMHRLMHYCICMYPACFWTFKISRDDGQKRQYSFEKGHKSESLAEQRTNFVHKVVSGIGKGSMHDKTNSQ